MPADENRGVPQLREPVDEWFEVFFPDRGEDDTDVAGFTFFILWRKTPIRKAFKKAGGVFLVGERRYLNGVMQGSSLGDGGDLAGLGGNDFNFYRSYAPAEYSDCFRRSHGKVDDTAFHEGAAVVDTDTDGFTVFEVGYFDYGIEGEGFVSGGEAVGVESFSAGGSSAVKFAAVP